MMGKNCCKISYRNILIFLILVFCNFMNSLFSAVLDEYGQDRYHSFDKPSISERFFEDKLKTAGSYDPKKIKKFIKYLYEEKNTVSQDVYETALLENFEIYQRKYKKAKKKAEEKKSGSGAKIVNGYNFYLIPQMEKLLHLVEENKDVESWDGIVDDFLRAYVAYYVPNAFRSEWPEDVQVSRIGAKMFRRHKYKKECSHCKEAFNLRSIPKYLPKIKKCLGKSIDTSYYFSPSDLSKLKSCKFDLSLLDPGVSGVWHDVTGKDSQKYLEDNPELFPQENQKITFTKVSYRSRTSPKIRGNFINSKGEKTKIKVKMGQEVHSDLAVSSLLKMVGLNQDVMIYRPKVRVYLKNTSYDEFISLFANKYTIESVARFITAHGTSSEGEDWIEVSDVLLEARPKNEVRVGPVDLGSWDLNQRREIRSLILLFAWLGLNDIRPENCKLVLRLMGEEYRPLLRVHDPGASLGGPFSLKKFKYLFSLNRFYRVNAFPESFIKLSKKGQVAIDWNDFRDRKRNFHDSTWADLKWMGRQISKISNEQILSLLLRAGIPEPVARIYHIKLLKRRNEIKKGFNLESEYPLDDTPDLDSINYKDEDGRQIIKKGKVVAVVFGNSNNPVQVAENWWTFLPAILTFKIPVVEWNFDDPGAKLSQSIRGLQGLQADLNLADYDEDSVSTSFYIGVGIQAILTRQVLPNSHILNSDEKMRLYRIIDTIRLRVGFDSPLLKRIMEKVSFLDVNLKVNFYEKKFEHIHFEDTVKASYLSAFKLTKIIKNIERYVSHNLEPLEVVNSSSKFGLDLNFGLGVYSLKPVVSNEIGVLGGSVKSLSRYYTRDQYGRLHFYMDKAKKLFGGLNLKLAEVDSTFLQLPLAAIRGGKASFDYQMRDYVVNVDANSREKNDLWKNPEHQEKEYSILENLKKDPEFNDVKDQISLNVSLDSRGKSQTKGLAGLYLFNKKKSKVDSKARVILPDGRPKGFYRYGTVKNRYVGVDRLGIIDASTYDMMVRNRKRSRVDIEMDLKKADNFVLILRTEDYYKSRSKDDLEELIDDLNRRFSANDSLPFYRSYQLPDEETVAEYPKVYALTRVYIKGELFIRSLNEMNDEALINLLYLHITKKSKAEYHEGNLFKKNMTKLNIRKIKFRISKLLKEYECYADDPSKISKYIVKVMNALKCDIYGIDILTALVGEEGLAVMGEISGIHRSYSSLNDLQQIQRRRFMARSWGEFEPLLPIQKFLRKNRIVLPSAFINKGLSDSVIFGLLETAIAPNIEDMYSHNNQF